VLTVDGDDTVQRLCDAVDAECLVCGGVVGFCLDDALLGDKPVVLTADRIFQQAFKHTVSLLSDLAGDGIRQHTQTEGGKSCSICGIKYGNHRQSPPSGHKNTTGDFSTVVGLMI